MADVKYTKSHEWIAAAGATRRAGVTDFAQGQLGDIVYVEFPRQPGETVAAGDEVCVIESCKATASVYAPIAGTLAAFNTALEAAPETVNKSPQDAGWLFEIEPAANADESILMDEAAYQAHCGEQAH